MNLLRGDYWKKQRRELVEIKKLPVRQCIGCRRVRIKDELLRFIKSSLGRIEFDENGTHHGRGFYLCPESGCFFNAYTNKRNRAVLFKNKNDVNSLIKEVQEALLKLIEKDCIIGIQMGYLINTKVDEDRVYRDNLDLIGNKDHSEAKAQLNRATSSDFSGISHLPAAQKFHIMGCVIRNEHPMIDRLAMNLMKYGMLSSKGHAI